MATLVLRQGRISEELVSEPGAYPRLRLVEGRIVAGGEGLDLCLIAGRITQAPPALAWDDIAWDAPWGVGWDDALWGVNWS